MWTLVWLLSCVYSDMCSQAALSCKPTLTQLALVWLLTSVCAHVLCQITLQCKHLATHCTFVRFVSLMYSPYMSLHVIFTAEHLVTERTLCVLCCAHCF